MQFECRCRILSALSWVLVRRRAERSLYLRNKDFGFEAELFHRKDTARDVPRAVFTVEVVNGEVSAIGHGAHPRIAQVAAAAIVTQNHFPAFRDVPRLGVEDARADAEGFVAVPVDQQNPPIRQKAY